MSTITRRSVNRRYRQGRPTLAATLEFVARNGIQAMVTGRPSAGSSPKKKLSSPRVLVANAAAGPFLIATFAHPTKKTSKTVVRRSAKGFVRFERRATGRVAYLTWRKPETPING